MSLFPIVRKVLEKQYGHIFDRSCVDTIISMISWFDQRLEKHVPGTFLDISSAFDNNLRCYTLCENMTCIGCTKNIIRISGDDLKNRKVE